MEPLASMKFVHEGKKRVALWPPLRRNRGLNEAPCIRKHAGDTRGNGRLSRPALAAGYSDSHVLVFYLA